MRAFPRDPLIISINGYQPWLEDILAICIEDYWSDLSDLDREVQFAGTMQFPEKASKKGRNVPWSFVLDHMNVGARVLRAAQKRKLTPCRYHKYTTGQSAWRLP